MKKKRNINKNEVYACILACLIILWSIAGVLGTIAFFRTRKSSNSSTIKASAQTATDISKSGQLVIELPYLDGFTLYNGIDQTFVFSAPKLIISNNALLIQTHDLYQFNVSTDSLAIYTLSSFVNGSGGLSTLSGAKSVSIVPYENYNHVFPSLYEFKAIFLDYFFYYNGGTNTFDVEIILRWDYQDNEGSFGFIMKYPFVTSPNNYGGCYIPFTGTAVGVLKTKDLRDTLGYGFPTAEFLQYYRLTSTLSPDVLLTYEMAYDKGFAEGREVGLNSATGDAFAEGEFIGYERGKKEGYNQGKEYGYQLGLNESNQYTFGNLLSAGFDVPIQAFTGLFNFDFLGVNLFNFFTALFTVALIIAVLRMFL